MPWGGARANEGFLCFGGTDQERERQEEGERRKWCEVWLNKKIDKSLKKTNNKQLEENKQK